MTTPGVARAARRRPAARPGHPSRRVLACVAALLVLAVGAACEPSNAPPRRPNLVLLLADDLGQADLGAFGSQTNATPHLDALAAQGVRFGTAYSVAASCSPARAGLLTGRHPQRFGLEFNTGPPAVTHDEGRGLPPSTTTLAEVLRAAGYATGAVGKWHLGSRDEFHPLEHGFGTFFGFLGGWSSYFPGPASGEAWRSLQSGRDAVDEDEYLTEAFAREAVEFVTRHQDEPFFLYVAFNAVHHPYDEPPDEYVARYPDAASERTRTYRAMVSALDDAVGRIVAALDGLGLTDDTIVVFASDHGGSHPAADHGGLRGEKLFLFEGGVRVPLVVRWPGVTEPGSRFESPVSLLDLFPTMAARVAPDRLGALGLDGVDLAPHLRGVATGPPHERLFWRNGSNSAIRRDRYKLVQAGDHAWLFDLVSDPGETHDLAIEEPALVDELRAELRDWEQGVIAPAWPSAREKPAAVVDGVPYELLP